MESPIKSPDELLAYRPLRDLLASKAPGKFSIGPDDPALAAMRVMADKHVGFLVVLDRGKLVGVLSERDCARKLDLLGRRAADTPVRDIMTADVVTVTTEESIPRCMALMNERGFRHLPVMEGGSLAGVVSIRDLVREVLAHHEHLIRDLELERLTTISAAPLGY